MPTLFVCSMLSSALQSARAPCCPTAASSRAAAAYQPVAASRPAAFRRRAQLHCPAAAACHAAAAAGGFDPSSGLEAYFREYMGGPEPGSPERQLHLVYELNPQLNPSHAQPSTGISSHGRYISYSVVHWLAEVYCPELVDSSGTVLWPGTTFYVSRAPTYESRGHV